MSEAPREWLAALEARHLANLRIPEVTRALRALSSDYVERRHALGRGAALHTAGKRAAFALFYAPLHFLITAHIVRELQAATPATVVDLGCGTGAAGAAWATTLGGAPRLVGVDHHAWAVEETRRTYRDLHLDGRAHQGDVTRFRIPSGHVGIVAAYVLNELRDEGRDTVVGRLIAAAQRGAQVLIVEPIATRIAPWWGAARARIEQAGGRADEWDVGLELPDIVATLDRAAGLDHRRIKARSLFVPVRQ